MRGRSCDDSMCDSEASAGVSVAGRPRRVVFFQSASQYEALRDTSPAQLEGATLVGLSSLLSPGQLAQRDGHDYRPYTDYLTEAEFAAAARQAQEVSLGWLKPPDGERDDPDLREAVRLEVLQPLHELLVAQRVISRALEQLRPEEATWAPGMDAKILAVLQYEAEQSGIRAVESGPRAAPEGRALVAHPRGLGAQLRTVLRALRQAAGNARPLVAHRARQRADPKPLVLAFGTGVDSINQERLLPAVEEDGRLRTLLLRAGDIDATMQNRPGWAKASDRARPLPVLHFVPWAAMLRTGRHRAACRRRWLAFLATQESYRGPYPFLFANPRLSPFFARLHLHLLPHALATRRDARRWLNRLRPALLLTSNDVSFPVRTLVLEARRQGIPTLGLIHSGLNNMHYRDFQSDRMAVWGQVHARDFERVLDKASASLVPIGNPQYDTLGVDREGAMPSERPALPVDRTGVRDTRPCARGSSLPGNHAAVVGQASTPAWSGEAGSQMGVVPRVVVLTAVAQWHMLYYNQREHLRAWRELERLPEHGIHVTIKPHPRFDDYAFYADLRHPLAGWREPGPGVSVVRDAFLEEVVPACDLVVVPNLPTTGGVEAMLLGKPVIYLMCGFAEVDCCTSIAAGCLVVREVEQIVPAILDVLGSREHQQELVGKGQAYLDYLLGPRDRGATRRLVRLMATMARTDAAPALRGSAT